jgi:PAS domain S-box-containing protein
MVRTLRSSTRLAAAVVALGGALVLLGWQLDQRFLQAIGPVDVVMNPLTALLFVLAGTALLLDERERPRGSARLWSAGCGLVIALCGGMVLLRSVAGWQIGVDEWLFRAKVLNVDPPDWMAGNAALNFVFLGLALLARRLRGGRAGRPAHWLVLPVALTSLLVVIGYLYGTTGFITFQLQLPMALNTALFFLAASFALIGARPDQGVVALFVSGSPGGAITRRFLPALLLIPLVFGAVVNLGMGLGWYGATAALALLTLATIVLSVLLTLTTAGAVHRSDLALRRSEEHFRALIENASDYVMIVDQQGAIQYVSPSVERILGFRPDEVLGENSERLVHPDDLANLYEAMRNVFAHPGEVFRAEFRVRHRDGSWRVFENVTRTLRADSAEAGALANARDITDRRLAEDEIARQKAYFEGILDSLDAGIAVFDPQGRFEYVSASAVRDPHIRRWVIGKTQEEYGRGRNLPREVTDARQRSLEEAIRTRSPNQFEQEVRRADGSTLQMLRRIVPIINEAAELERLVAFSVDISDRKAAEVALQAAKEEAERANRAKSEFLSRMSHELRTPMNAILGFAQVLERRGVSPDQEKHLAHILTGGRHLLRLINEVLDLARIESGRLALSLEPVSVGEVVQEAIALVRPLADGSDNALVFDGAVGPEVFASADRQRVSQVLINLLSNAIKYNRAGGLVRITARASESVVAVRVRDHGRGIPAERLDQLFTPFARLGAEATETEGTGLGLALSRRLAEAMGGTLVLEETGAEGSTFRLELPLASDPRMSLRHVQGPGNGAADDSGSAGTILYIEDNLMNLSLVEAVLESKPMWKTLSALRGEAGIELAKEKKPDLILLDLHLPDLPGNEVLARLRADPSTAEIPVVIISADATDRSQARLRAAGASDYLTKPLDLDAFMAVVERFLPNPASVEGMDRRSIAHSPSPEAT